MKQPLHMEQLHIHSLAGSPALLQAHSDESHLMGKMMDMVE